MTTATLTQSDLHLRAAATRQLDWDSQVDAGAIGVAAKDGIMTLTGFVDSYASKLAAERAVKRVRGVRAVANDLQVRLRLDRTDADIAADAVRALDLRGTLPNTIQVTVHNGHVTLTGTAHMLFQRVVAEKAVRHVRGIKWMVNRIEVTPAATAQDVRPDIVQALQRDAHIGAEGLEVTVSENAVTLTGTVRTWYERDSAERAAMHAPGITVVDNRVTVTGEGGVEGEADGEIS